MKKKRSEASAFGIEPGRMPYRLRLAKYYAIGETIGHWTKGRQPEKAQLTIVDVGGDEGRVFRYVGAFLGEDGFHGTIVDLFPKGTERVWQKDKRQLIQADLEQGFPMLESNSFDVVICEQVLEHLSHPETLIAEMSRVLKPGGICIMGVPSFPPVICWVRGSVVPWLDRRRNIKRAHEQAFSLKSFSEIVTRSASWEILDKRGFRVVSGGFLKPLENYRWWWLLNRWLGSKVPSLCIEVQIVAANKPG